jgi:hypothetical protein
MEDIAIIAILISSPNLCVKINSELEALCEFEGYFDEGDGPFLGVPISPFT